VGDWVSERKKVETERERERESGEKEERDSEREPERVGDRLRVGLGSSS